MSHSVRADEALPQVRTTVHYTDILNAYEAWTRVKAEDVPKRLAAILLPLQDKADPVAELLSPDHKDRERDLVAGFALIFTRYRSHEVYDMMGQEGLIVKGVEAFDESARYRHSLMSALAQMSNRFLGTYDAFSMNQRFERERTLEDPSDIRYQFSLFETVIESQRAQQPMTIGRIQSSGGTKEQSISGTMQKGSCLHFDLKDTELGRYLTECSRVLTKEGDYTVDLAGSVTEVLPKSKA